MLKPGRVVSLCIGALAITIAPTHAEPKVMPAIDAALDIKNLMGQEITAQGCQLWGARLSDIQCEIDTDTGSVGSLTIKTEQLDRADLKQALMACAGLVTGHQCIADVTGTVSRDFIDEPVIIATELTWSD